MTTQAGEALPEPGDEFAGKYTIIRVVGEGGVAVVYEAHHQRLNQRVALKVLRSEVRRSGEWRARFDREARAAVALHGPHVTRIYDVDSLPDGTPFMVMELLEGHDLAGEINTRGRLPVAEAVNYILQAGEAMAEAHALGIVHRDLSPRNLFLVTTGSQKAVKVLDFGISKILSERSDITTSDAAFGTPNYVSPEQIRASGEVDSRADIWSLAVILFEMLTCTLPFQGNSASAMVASVIADRPKDLREIRPDVPRKLAAAITKALEKDPGDRYQRVEEFLAALAPFGSQDPAAADLPPSSVPFAGVSGTWARPQLPAPRPAASGRIRWFVVAMVGVATAIAVPVLRYGLRSAPAQAPSTEDPTATTEAVEASATPAESAAAPAESAATPAESAAMEGAPEPTATNTGTVATIQARAIGKPPSTRAPSSRPSPATRTTRAAPAKSAPQPQPRVNPLHL